jgi:DNA-binding NarL/FixJ family response regulator
MNEIRLFLVDDEPLVRRGLRMRLGMELDFLIVGEAGDPRSAIEAIGRERPDVVLMDIQMSDTDGIAMTAEVGEIAPSTRVIIVSMQDDASTRQRAFAAGAVAFVGKHEIDSELTDAIRSAVTREGRAGCDGGRGFNRRQRDRSAAEMNDPPGEPK